MSLQCFHTDCFSKQCTRIQYSILINTSFCNFSEKVHLRKRLSDRATTTVFQKQLPDVFYKKSVLQNFTKFTGKHLCRSLIFNEVSLAQMFSQDFYKIFKNTSGFCFWSFSKYIWKSIKSKRKWARPVNFDIYVIFDYPCQPLIYEVST